MLLKASELTVCIFQDSPYKHLIGALKSVLQQQSIDLEVILVSSSALDADLPSDPRLSVLPKTSRKYGTAYNAALRNSSASFFAIVGSSDVVLPGALRKMTDVCKSEAEIGMTHCFSYPINELGNTTREHVRSARENSLLFNGEGFDLKRELLVRGFFLSHLRVFRKEVIESCGGFDSTDFPDLFMALKLLDRYRIQLVPEYLYCRRITKSRKRWDELRNWKRRYFNVRSLGRTIQFLNEPVYKPAAWRKESLLRALRIDVAKTNGNLNQSLLRKRLQAHAIRFFYYRFVSLFRWWPIDWSRTRATNTVSSGHVAYYTWHFPVFSQTFVNREMEALTKCGISLSIIAEEQENPELADEKAKLLLQNTSYLRPMEPKKLSQYLKHFFFHKPLTSLNLLIFLLAHRYSRFKSAQADWFVYCKAVYLAGMLKERNIRHIHSPWADESAIIALVASRLLNITFSLQARAHEIHRELHQFAFRKAYPLADFLITNTRYNENHIHSLMENRNGNKIYTIYNGLDLEQLRPPVERKSGGELILLSVARLIEQKGLIYLLRACRNLISRGYRFRCEIVGGPEQELYMNYYLSLKKTHRQLNLSDFVTFIGPLSFKDVRQKYCESDIFILPCVIAADGSRDIIPNSLLEAMAMELPVISTNVAAIPEIVQHGINGLLVSPGDEEELTSAIIKLIEHPELRDSLGKNARKRIEEKFDVSKNILQYARLFLSNGGI